MRIGNETPFVYSDDGSKLFGVLGPDGSLLPMNAAANLVELSGSVTLTAPLPANTVFVNKSGNAYTVTLGAAGVGNFSVLNAGSGSVSVGTPGENLFTYSKDFTQTVWSNFSCSSVKVNTGSPVDNGAYCAVTTSAANGAALSYSISAAATGVCNTASVWVQGVGTSIGTYIQIGNYNNGRKQYRAVKLTSSWQKISLSFAPEQTTNLNVFIDLNNNGGTVPNGATVNIADAQLVTGQNKSYAVTTGTATSTSPTNIQANTNFTILTASSSTCPQLDIVENSSGNYFISPRQNGVINLPGNKISNGFLLVNCKSNGETVKVACCDSVNPYNSDVILTGSTDQTVLNTIYQYLNGIGGNILLRVGTVLITAPIIADASQVTLKAESFGFWNRFNGAYVYSGSSYEGMATTKIKQLTANTNIINVGSTFLDGDSRHHGLIFENLYLYGNGGTGIYDTGNTDISKVIRCCIHNVADAINIAWDTPEIFGNTLQSNSGKGVIHNFVFGSIHDNIIYDNGGAAIVLANASGGVSVHNNTIGSLSPGSTSAAIISNGNMNKINNNTIVGLGSGDGILLSGSACKNNTVTGNTISIDNNVGIAVAANTSGNGIHVASSATYNSIGNNSLNQTQGTYTITGAAVLLDSGTSYNGVNGNTCSGGKWNSGSTTQVIVDNGSNNRVSGNPGNGTN